MQRHAPHLSRPLYEFLPWIYIICGVLLLIGSYLLSGFAKLSLAVGVAGLAGVVGGYVVLLRRRDYRALRAEYADPDSLGDDKP
jgi:hypothetical protein